MVLFNRLALAPLQGTGLDTLFRAAEEAAGRAARAGSQVAPFTRGLGGVDLTHAELVPTEKGAHLTLMAPGFGPDDIEISVKRDTVTVTGKKERDGETKHSFTRTFRTPFPIDADTAAAKVEHGVLELELPRHASAEPKMVKIAGATEAPREVDVDVDDSEASADEQ